MAFKGVEILMLLANQLCIMNTNFFPRKITFILHISSKFIFPPATQHKLILDTTEIDLRLQACWNEEYILNICNSTWFDTRLKDLHVRQNGVHVDMVKLHKV